MLVVCNDCLYRLSGTSFRTACLYRLPVTHRCVAATAARRTGRRPVTGLSPGRHRVSHLPVGRRVAAAPVGRLDDGVGAWRRPRRPSRRQGRISRGRLYGSQPGRVRRGRHGSRVTAHSSSLRASATVSSRVVASQASSTSVSVDSESGRNASNSTPTLTRRAAASTNGYVSRSLLWW